MATSSIGSHALRLAFLRSLAAFALALAVAFAPAATSPAWALYLLDYGDNLAVTINGAPQYSYSGSIRPDGVITLPYLGDLEVRGLTPDQVRERVRELAGRVLRNPEVNVTVTAYKPRVVTVLGEVAKPGNVDITRADQSVLDTIAAAGGFTDHALPAEVVVLRGNGSATRRIPVDVKHMMATGDLSGNVRLEPGDRVQVPRSLWPTWRDTLAALQAVSVISGVFFLIIRLGGQLGGP